MTKEINILVVPREEIKNPNTFWEFSQEELNLILEKSELKWRADMEEDKSYKQFIPYIAVISKGKLLTYRRTPKGTETRLHDKYSLGVGGHVDEYENLSGMDLLVDATLREIEEEIGVKVTKDQVNFVGFINDESDNVGIYHIGIAAILNLDSLNLNLGETDILDNREFMSKTQVKEIYDKLENWSKTFFDKYLVHLDNIIEE